MFRIFPIVFSLVFLGAACNRQPDIVTPAVVKGHYSDGSLKIADKEISIEIAETQDQQSQGLSGRESIEENQGMLFIFPLPDFPVFWMKDMNFPIDIVWIKGDAVIEITKNVQPQPGVPNEKLITYSPRKPADKVLELKAGWADRNGLKVGEKVEVTRIVQ